MSENRFKTPLKKDLFSMGLSMLLTLAGCSNNSSFTDSMTDSEVSHNSEVYICNSETSYAFHKTNTCKGLNNCSSSIIKITLTEAKNKGKTPCKLEYP